MQFRPLALPSLDPSSAAAVGAGVPVAVGAEVEVGVGVVIGAAVELASAEPAIARQRSSDPRIAPSHAAARRGWRGFVCNGYLRFLFEDMKAVQPPVDVVGAAWAAFLAVEADLAALPLLP
jgi:hypothetical protein